MSDCTPSLAGKTRRRFRPGTAVAITAILIVVAFIALRNRDPTRPAQLGRLVGSGDAAGFNLLLVTLDTVRRDRLGCYGYKSAETPGIDSLGEHGVRFDDAVTSFPLTLPSHATMLTGLYPPNHGVRDNGTYSLAPEHVTLAESLKARGYQTAAFIGAFVLDQRFGLNQGFDLYDFQVDLGLSEEPDVGNERSAAAVTSAAIQWLHRRQTSAGRAPFFVWVHYFDPHLPYESPLGSLSRFAGRPYDAEIAFVDLQFRRLLEELNQLGLRDRTLIALVSDHGEAFGEHQEPNHGMLLYGCTMRVAFLLSCPALFDRAYRVDDRVVGLVDLRATLEDLLGISPATPSDGQSLLSGEPDPHRAIYIETLRPFYNAGWSPLYGLRRHNDKFILAPEPEYYDLRNDPDELNNLYASNPAHLETLERELARQMEHWPTSDPPHSTRIMSDEEVERLASLGYFNVGASVPSGDLPDPKAMMPVHNLFVTASTLHDAGRNEEALALARQAADQCDTYTLGTCTLAKIYLQLGRADEAVGVLRKALQRGPDIRTLTVLARALLDLKRYDEAVDALAAAEALDPADGRVFLLRGDCFVRQHRYRDALTQYEQALRVDEQRFGSIARDRMHRVKTQVPSGDPS